MSTTTPNIRPPMRELDGPAQDALEASISKFGVLVPLMVDREGHILDGRLRAAIADRLNIPYPVEVISDEARAAAVSLGVDRHQLSPEWRRAVEVALVELGHSQRAIADAMDLNRSVVSRDIERWRANGQAIPADMELALDGWTPPDLPSRACSRCKRELPLTSFARDRTNPAGRNWECKACSRLRLGARPEINPSKTRKAVNERTTRIRELAGKGWLADQIAREVDLSVSRVRQVARANNIDLRADRVVGKVQSTNWTRVMNQVALDADTIAEGTAGLNYSALDGDSIDQWIESIEQAISDLQTIRRNLRAERTRRT